eukprot:jgi/Tetstr1/448583/TSEL_035832.t1
MAGGMKAGGSSNEQPKEKSSEKTPEPVEQVTAEATLAIVQARKHQSDSLSTRLENQKEVNQQRANPATNDAEDEGGNDPVHDTYAAVATENDDGDDGGEFIDPRDWVDDLPRAYHDILPLGAVGGNNYGSASGAKRHRHPHEEGRLRLTRIALRTFAAMRDANEARVTYVRPFKVKKALTGEEQVAERLLYSRVFDPAEDECSASVVDGLLPALEDERLEVGLLAAAKTQAAAHFKKKEREEGRPDTATSRKIKDKMEREKRERERREAETKNKNDEAGAWKRSTCAWWVSRAFFVSKPGDNWWRFIIDMRVLNTYCARKSLRMETPMGVRHLNKKGDYMLCFALQDGFSDRDYFTVNIRGELCRLCGLPMGWSLSPYYLVTFTMTFVRGLRSSATSTPAGNVLRSRRWLRRGRWRGARILPYVDDFLLFASSSGPEPLELRHRPT